MKKKIQIKDMNCINCCHLQADSYDDYGHSTYSYCDGAKKYETEDFDDSEEFLEKPKPRCFDPRPDAFYDEEDWKKIEGSL